MEVIPGLYGPENHVEVSARGGVRAPVPWNPPGFLRTREGKIDCGFRVPRNPEPAQDFGFPREDNKSVCELSIISKTLIKMDLKMGSRSLGKER